MRYLDVSALLRNQWNKHSARKKIMSEGSTLPSVMPTSPTYGRPVSLAESVSQVMEVMSQDESEEELDTQYVPFREYLAVCQ